MSEVIGKLVPVILIIVLGIFLRRKQIISLEAINGLKQLITKVALPAVLFLSFSKSKIESAYVIIFAAVFVMCCMLYVIGMLFNKKVPRLFNEQFAPGFFTGFELGMVGIGLFTALWGIERLPVLMLIGLGHELFIWFVYVPLLEYRNSGTFNLKGTLQSFVLSPIIIAIVAGIAVNLLGLSEEMLQNSVGAGSIQTLTLLSQMTSPLILIVIGHSIVLKEVKVKKVISYITARVLCTGLIGIAALALIHIVVGEVHEMFNLAFFFFLMLPPPYILPLFIKDNKEEEEFFSQILVCFTLLSFVAYILLMFIQL